MNNLNLNPQIGFHLGSDLCTRIEKLCAVAPMQVIEDKDTNLLRYIKSNYLKKTLTAPDLKNHDFLFRTEVNGDLVIVFLAKELFHSFALRIHNAFTPIPNSTNKYLWTIYSPDDTSKFYVDTTKKCSYQIAELTRLYTELKEEIEKLV